MKRRRKSPIWNMSVGEFKKLVDNSESIADAIHHFGLRGLGNTYYVFKSRAAEDGIDLSGIRERARAKSIRMSVQHRFKPLEEVLVKHSSADSRSTKIRLLNEGRLQNVCQVCGLGPIWNGLKLTLRLDHINGINTDYQMENLRLVCPNCDSQLDTYCGRNRVKNPRTIKNCMDCGKALSAHKGLRCRRCNNRIIPRHTKIDWPSPEKLLEMVNETSKLDVAKRLGVSDMAVRKKLKSAGLYTPRPYMRSTQG